MFEVELFTGEGACEIPDATLLTRLFPLVDDDLKELFFKHRRTHCVNVGKSVFLTVNSSDSKISDFS
jgi:hypothetical protein